MSTPMHGWQGTHLSESRFAFAATFEIVESLGGLGALSAAPVVPSLRSEADLGFDVAIPGAWVTLYLQYKLSRRLVTGQAGQYYHFGQPYFRFYVKTDGTANGTCQHNVLCALEQRLAGSSGIVFYAAPIFTEPGELNGHMRARRVTDYTVFARPTQLGAVTLDTSHCYCYTSPGDVTPFSVPGEPVASSFSRVRAALVEEASEPSLLSSHLRTQYEVLRASADMDLDAYQSPRDLAAASAMLGLQAIVVLVSQTRL